MSEAISGQKFCTSAFQQITPHVAHAAAAEAQFTGPR